MGTPAMMEETPIHAFCDAMESTASREIATAKLERLDAAIVDLQHMTDMITRLLVLVRKRQEEIS
jgi:hypothetical protein